MTNQQTKRAPQKQTTSQSSRSRSPLADRQLTFIEHIYELRNRLFWVVAVLVVTSSIGFQFKDYLVNFVVAPLHGEKLIYLTPGGGFSFIFTICLYFGALLTIPVIVYHIYRFLQPVLEKTSRKFIVILMLLSSLLAVAGAVFGYGVAIPAAINFLTTFAGDAVAPNLTAESYLGFVVAYMVGLAALFQLPLLLFMFDHIRPFPPGTLLSSQRFVIVGSIVAAAVITPTPDMVNQMIVAGPIIVVYQLGAIAVYVRRMAGRRRERSRLVKSSKVTFKASPETAPPYRAPSPAAPAVAAPRPVTTRRTVDGFVRTRPPASVAVPPRTTASVSTLRPASTRVAQGRPLRTTSIDGLSII